MMVAGIELDGETMDELRQLVASNLQCHRVLRDTADMVHEPDLTAQLYRLARRRKEFALQLQRYLDPREPLPASRALGPLHRVWLDLKRRLGQEAEPHVAFAAAACSQERIDRLYRQVIGHVPEPLGEMLEQQREILVTDHTRLHQLHRRAV